MGSGWTAEECILVLQTHHVDVVEVQKFSGLLIRRHVVLCERPPYSCGIVIAQLRVVQWQCQQSSSPVLLGNRAAQVSGERSDSTMSWKIVPDDRDSARERRLQMRPCTHRCIPDSQGYARADHFQDAFGGKHSMGKDSIQ